MIEWNGKQYGDWEEYISDKFPVDQFHVSISNNEADGKIITVTAKDPVSKTEIVVDFPASGLCRVYFYHPDAPLHNAYNDRERLRALMYSDYELTEENLQATNKYLEIPLRFGWTEQVSYYKGKLNQSETLYYDGVAWQTIPIEQHLSWFDEAGCLLIAFTWPILYIQYRLVKFKLNKENKNVQMTSAHIPPMIK